MIGFVTIELAPLPSQDAAWVESMQERIHTINVAKHPHLARYISVLANRAILLRWESGTTMPLHESFDLCVEALIGGLEASLALKPNQWLEGE